MPAAADRIVHAQPAPSPGRAPAHEPAPRGLWRLATAPARTLPDALIVGAMKAGTTFLYRILRRHPDFLAPVEKELHFFDNNFHRGVLWYRSRFPIRAWVRLRRAGGRTLIAGESSPYYLFHPLAPSRAAEVCPSARIIILLRNPVDRAYSHHQQYLRQGFETLPFAEAIEAEPERLRGEEERLKAEPRYYSAAHQTFSYLARGDYAPQVERWIDAFGRERVLVLQAERLFEQPRRTYTRVREFLGLAPFPLRRFRPQNEGRYSELDPALRERLQDHFRAPNERLFELLGERFEWE